MSGCEHYFCHECVSNTVVQKIKDGQVAGLVCADAQCKRPINDRDVKAMGLEESLLKQYEQVSLENAISQMDDMGWCPLSSCSQLAHIDRPSNSGTCSFCQFHFCLDCKQHYHPFKRCAILRVDMQENLNENVQEQVNEIIRNNEESEDILSRLFIKLNTKSCPNPKCRVPISKDASGCTQIQCTRCFNYFCWACGAPAKGQKHYKENPDHHSDEGTLLPYEVTPE